MKLLMDKTERIVVGSSENDLVDVMRGHIKYLREDSIFDQLNRDGKLMLIALVLVANFLIMLVAAFSGLM
jgi:hypothetical protein